MKRVVTVIWIVGLTLSSCSFSSEDPELAGFCDRALEAVRLNDAAMHYGGEDQAALQDLIVQAGEASQEFSLGAAPQAIADEMAIVHEYKSDPSINLDETYLEANFAVTEYAGTHCEGLSLAPNGVLELDSSAGLDAAPK